MARRRDAGIAIGLLALSGALALRDGIHVAPRWLAIGALGTVGVEAVLYLGPAWIRRRLASTAVAVGSGVIAVVLLLLASAAAPSRVLSLAIGALATYCCLLVSVAGFDRMAAGDE